MSNAGRARDRQRRREEARLALAGQPLRYVLDELVRRCGIWGDR